LNHPVWDIPHLGSGWIIGLISIVHVSIAHLVVGAGLWLPIMEGRAQRAGDLELQAWLRSRAKALLWLSSIFGAVPGVGLVGANGPGDPQAPPHPPVPARAGHGCHPGTAPTGRPAAGTRRRSPS